MIFSACFICCLPHEPRPGLEDENLGAETPRTSAAKVLNFKTPGEKVVDSHYSMLHSVFRP